MVALFSAALFLSATLLFTVQPMAGKMLLPVLGGTPAVWNTCLVFFQTTLLLGYAYAHVTTAALGVRRQAILHLALLPLPLVVMPVGLGPSLVESVPRQTSPIGWLLVALTASVGFPFFVLSTSAPLLQRWFASTDDPSAADPYFLYAASNMGSLLALAGYPILLEPALGLSAQCRAWTAGYGVFALLVAACALAVWRRASAEDGRVRPETDPCRAPGGPGEGLPPAAGSLRPAAGRSAAGTAQWSGLSLTPARRVRWAMLALAPSSLMLGVTTCITTDIAPVPLLWAVPMTLYLMTFVLAFSPRTLAAVETTARMLPPVALALVTVLALRMNEPGWFVVPLHLVAFTLAALACHGRLARDRPEPAHLTGYYLWVSIGGALGGALNAIVAPLVFDSLAEYWLATVLACLLWGRRTGATPDQSLTIGDVALPAAAGLAAVALLRVTGATTGTALVVRLVIVAPAVILAVLSLGRPFRFALALVALALGTTGMRDLAGRTVHAQRSFFGILRVTEDSSSRTLSFIHGTTLHGRQSLEPDRRRDPQTYFDPTGPVGQVFEAATLAGTRGRVAVLGLGAGSLATYARPGDRWTFFEIDPAVERIARDASLFTFLADCRAQTLSVVLGDGRIQLAAAPDREFGVIVMDAFASDSLPVHLITREAFGMYVRKLAPGGLIAVNVSNRYLDLAPVIAGVARDLSLLAASRSDRLLDAQDQRRGKEPSDWVVVTRRVADLGPIATDRRWAMLHGRPGSRVWTDDYSNVLAALVW